LRRTISRCNDRSGFARGTPKISSNPC